MTRQARRRRWRTTLLVGAGFFLVQLGWILSIAPHYGIDEFDHTMRASSVASGHWGPGDNQPPPDLGRGDLIPVRADVAAAIRGACEARPYTKSYNCQPAERLADGEVLIASGAARYNPVFYAVVGIVAAPFHGTSNLYAMRVVAALIGCVLLMGAVWLAAGRARTIWPVAVIVLAVLPTTAYSASIATPNGAEMIAGLGVWVALLALTDRAASASERRSAYVSLGVFVAVLVNLHTLGVLWLALIALTVAILRGPLAGGKALLPTDGIERLVAVLTFLALAFEAIWVLMAGTNDPAAERGNVLGSAVGPILNSLLLWPLQAIGAFPMRNDSAPPAVYAIVLVILGTLAVLALRRTPLRSRAMGAFGFVAAGSFAVPIAMTLVTYHQLGVAWQGRYGMPFTVGLLVLAGLRLDAPTRPLPRARALAAIAVTTVALAQFLSQWSVMTTQRAGFELVTRTNWVPPNAALLVTLAALAALCWTQALRRDRSADESEHDPHLLQEATS